MDNKNFAWSKLYVDSNFKEKILEFCVLLKNIQDQYDILSEEELLGYSAKYLICWQESIKILSRFLSNNLIFVETSKECVTYLIYTGAFEDGKTFFKLYRGMENLKRNKYKVPKKYFQDEYIALFYHIEEFLSLRYAKEVEYGMVC